MPYSRDYYLKHREEILKYQKDYAQKHKKEIKRYMKRYNRDYYQKHRKKAKQHNQDYYQRHKEKAKDYNQTHREKIKQYLKQRQKKIKQKIHKLLGGKCVKCGYIGSALQIDHVRNNGAEERKKYKSYVAYLRHILKQIKGGSKDYQLLCANCNWEKRYLGDEIATSK